jgi:hypothetical protein
MAKKKGQNTLAAYHRRILLERLAIKNLSLREITEALKKQGVTVNERTIKRDIAALRDSWLERAAAQSLYSLHFAFSELLDLQHEAWLQYTRPPVQMMTKKGPIALDDRGIKTGLLRELREITMAKSKLCGFFSSKAMERITMVETATGRGLRIERITFDEQTKLGVDELENNEGLARAEGLHTAD